MNQLARSMDLDPALGETAHPARPAFVSPDMTRIIADAAGGVRCRDPGGGDRAATVPRGEHLRKTGF